MIGRNTEVDEFRALVEAINEKLGPSSGIDSADVDENELQQLMEAYVSNESEWKRYYFASDKVPYTRNLVDKGNGKSNLLILVWGPGKKSPIHERTCRHANAHCIMKVLRGRLTETRFATPSDEDVRNHRPMKKIRETTYSENQVTYMADNLGTHRISNPDPTDYAVSLHLYTPPNAATFGCNVFKEETSDVIHNKQCHFFSEYGIKMSRD